MILDDANIINPFAKDVHDFGMLLLNLAFGDLKDIETPPMTSTGGVRPYNLLSPKRSTHCCILHSSSQTPEPVNMQQGKIAEFKMVRHRTSKTSIKLRIKKLEYSPTRLSEDPKQNDTTPSLFALLAKSTRFTHAFRDFLCCCLKYDPYKRSNIKDLLSHRFLSDKHDFSGPLLTLNKIVSMSRISMEPEDRTNGTTKKYVSAKLSETLQIALLDNEVKSKFDANMRKYELEGPYDKRIVDISYEIGVLPTDLWDRLSKLL
jgi:serine/threonine protein kinase